MITQKNNTYIDNRPIRFFDTAQEAWMWFCFCETMQIICASFLKCNMPSMKMHEKNKSNPKSCTIWYAILKNCKF